MSHILVVEDHEINREMLTEWLELRGYAVAVAVDGAEALARVARSAPDLILMDMSLPSLDGWEVTRRLKASPATSAIPIIALTAHAMAGDRERCLAAGCDDYATKPLDVKRLVIQIQALLHGKRPEAYGRA